MSYVWHGIPFIVSCAAVFAYIYLYRTNKSHTAVLMANSGFLFVSNITKAQSFFSNASKYVKNVLYIKLTNENESSISQDIATIYNKATTKCNNLDVRLIIKSGKSQVIQTSHPVDVILYEKKLSKVIDGLKVSVRNINNSCTLQGVEIEESSSSHVPETSKLKKSEYVALGGTFDRLHNGHKILLSAAALRTTKQLTVGVTDVNMIKGKKLYELIEPVEKRVKSVVDFLTDINPDIEYNVLPIQDLFGPTKDDPNIQLIVVSEETTRGADKINELRKEKGLPLLDVFVIGLVEDTSDEHSADEEAKISSSNQRMRLLGSIIKPPQPNNNIPPAPYVIGLAGSIGSGKTSIAQKLKAKGAGVINCDTIAHDLYKPGLPLNRSISDHFGEHVITDKGEVDRAKLGQIVFSDTNALQRLNELVWPAVLEECQRRIAALGRDGHRVVVVEAAVMLRAGWYRYCHQVWTVVVPPEEAIKRIQERNNLSADEAKKRLASQPTNEEHVAIANVVFSTLWSYEFTQAQVDKAWRQLQPYVIASLDN